MDEGLFYVTSAGRHGAPIRERSRFGVTPSFVGEYIGKEEYQEFVSFILRDPQMQQNPPSIFMTTDTPTDVKITTPETSEDQMTSFDSSITIPYPEFGTNVSPEMKAIRIRSKESITVAVSAHQDITTLIPTEKLSTSYIFSTPIRDSAFQAFIAISVTAIHDNTCITFSDLGDSTSQEYTLNALETRIQEYRGTDPRAYNVQSSKPVAVFCGMYCMSDANCNNIIEQIPPSSQLDTVYIIPPNIDKITAVLIVPQKDTTLFEENDSFPVVAGNIYPGGILNDVLIRRSTDPIIVTTYALDEDLSVGAPYWTVVPGVNQYLPRYKIIIQNGWNSNYIAIMIRKSAVGGLRVNEQSIDANSIRFEKDVVVEAVEYSVIVAEVTEGELTLDTIDDTPFGLMVYGSRPVAGYGFAGNVILP
ncbi:IgGFc-binding protein-like [Ostrea edulis]|uniref:IgGFc-binding protein-like n=1 Tax=Ostrea edulis TaxID=37623 RepID=UPI0024AED7BB|nr:IgGFc-binding protein-like [Ostrea edulis]